MSKSKDVFKFDPKKLQEEQDKFINTKDIFIDDLYQRELQPARVRKMAGEFDYHKVNPLQVSFRDGKYWCYNGMHTMELLKYMNGGKDLDVKCRVVYGLTWLDEVELFLAQSGKYARAVAMNDKFRTKFNSGDKDVVKMVRLAEKCGILVDFKPAKTDCKIVALSTLYRIFTNMEEQEYIDFLTLIMKTWHGSKDSLSTEMLRGMYVFFKTYNGRFDKKCFINRVGRYSPASLIREGKASFAPGDIKFARQILSAYNYNARNRLPDEL